MTGWRVLLMTLAVAAMAAAGLYAPPAPAAVRAVLPPVTYSAEVISVVDGDTLKVRVEGWPPPFSPISVRIDGIDTPEHRKPPAKSLCEVRLGEKARTFAAGLARPGDLVTVTWRPGHNDKYLRLLASVTLADGRDWAAAMIGEGLARPYGVGGNLHKASWCPSPAKR